MSENNSEGIGSGTDSGAQQGSYNPLHEWYSNQGNLAFFASAASLAVSMFSGDPYAGLVALGFGMFAMDSYNAARAIGGAPIAPDANDGIESKLD
jgi:hypothetical protein